MLDLTTERPPLDSDTTWQAVNCVKIMLPGPEDITIDPDTGWAYISSLDRSGGEEDQSVRGGIFGLDMGRADLHPVELSTDFPASLPFHPHGFSLYRDPAQRMKRLFVINHRAQGDDAIEIFDVVGEHLQYRRSIHGGPLLTFPNDIAAIGPEQCYVTNTFHYSSAFMRTIELLPGFGRGNVVYCDGTGDGTFIVVADPVPGANGIAVDKDRNLLYVAAAFARKVLAYPLGPEHPRGPAPAAEGNLSGAPAGQHRNRCRWQPVDRNGP